MIKIIHEIFGYCGMCNRWFVYPKRRRMNTMYENEESNYCNVCEVCFEEIEDYWKELWDEYNSGRL